MRSQRYRTDRVTVNGERPRNFPSTGSGTGCAVTVTVTYSGAVGMSGTTVTVVMSRLLYPKTADVCCILALTAVVAVAKSVMRSFLVDAVRAPSRSAALIALSSE